MGFNIGVHTEQIANDSDCYNFIDRVFYNFVNSGEIYGKESILIQSGRYYGIDLSPLLKLVYTWGEVSPAYIKENLQDTQALLDLVTMFRDGIRNDPLVCDKINYNWKEIDYLTKKFGEEGGEIYSMMMTERKKYFDDLISKFGEEAIEPWLNEKKYNEQHTNPWKLYFEEGQIIHDLDSLIKRLQCYRDKGVTEVYLTAG